MVDISSTVTGLLPRFGGNTFVTFFTWALIAGIFLIGIGVVAFIFIRWLKFNNKILVFEKINNQFQPTKRDKAMEVKVSKAGDTVFYLRRHKKYLPPPTLQTGIRVYWFWIREDGEWINFQPGDFDKEARRLGCKFLDKEVRFARSQIQKALKERYDKPGFWKQYGLLIFSISFIMVISIMAWFLFDKWIEGLNAVPSILAKLETLLEEVNRLLGAMDNVCGGKGYVPVS